MPRVMETAKQMSFDEYLEFEKTSEVRHEFVDGFVFAMVGQVTYTISLQVVCLREPI
jgi:hypothetical protein